MSGGADRYRIERRIARGGMAEILEATAIGAAGFERAVAIKRLLPEHGADPSFERMFIDEARIASRLHHPNIVAVLDFGVAGGAPFQVLELVDGLDAARLRKRGEELGLPLDIESALHIVAETARGLHHAHSASGRDGRPLGIVHRDVSPANVLVSWTGEVKLSDFGVAFAHDREERTTAGTAKGKLLYMSPEQATGGAVDARSDVFALGCTLHTLAIGRSPLRGEDALGTLLRGGELSLDAELDAEVAAIVARAVRRERAARYGSAGEMAETIAALLAARWPGDPRRHLAAWLERVRPRTEAKARDRVQDLFAAELLAVAPGEDGIPRFAAAETRATTPARRDSATVASPAQAAPAGGRSRVAGWTLVAVLVAAAGGGGVLAAGTLDGVDAEQERASNEPHGNAAVERDRSAPPTSDDETHAVPVDPALPADERGTEYAPADERPADARPADERPADERRTDRTRSERRAEESETEGSPHERGAGAEAEEGVGAEGATGTLRVGGAGAHRAEVLVDGRSYGHAPIQIELPFGMHTVEVVSADGARAARRTRITPLHTPSSPARVHFE